MVRERFDGPKEWLNTLGPITRVCYLKRIWEDGEIQDPGPEYCHEYGEHWPEDDFTQLADEFAHDARGKSYIINRGHTVTTDHGIEDVPVRTGATMKTRSNPSQGALALTQVQIRTPSQFLMFVRSVGPAALAALPLPLFRELVLKPLTRFTPAERAWLIGGLGSLLAVLIASKKATAGVGMFVSMLVTIAPDIIDSNRVTLAIDRDLSTTPAPAPAATTTPTPAPAPTATTPSSGVAPLFASSRAVTV